MYLIEEMIDMGLQEGEVWPSPDHRIVAASLVIGNGNVRDRGMLNNVVASVCRVPADRIRSVTADDLIRIYKMDSGVVYGSPYYV